MMQIIVCGVTKPIIPSFVQKLRFLITIPGLAFLAFLLHVVLSTYLNVPYLNPPKNAQVLNGYFAICVFPP